MINVAVVGYGYWGPNIVRNVMDRPELSLWGLCEMSDERVEKFTARYPGVRTTADFDEVLADPSVDAVSIATPPRTHFKLVKRRSRPASTCSSRSRSRPAASTRSSSSSSPSARASC